VHIFAESEAEKLEQAASLYLQEHYKKTSPDARIEIKLNPISRKIKLKTCLVPFDFQTPKGNGSRITFRARCQSPLWQLFIAAEVKQFGLAVVSRTSLPRKTYLSEKNTLIQEVDITSLRSAYFTNSNDITGWITKRSIAANTIITAPMLKAPLTISKGNAVIIEAKRNGVSIRTSGTALEDGTLGEQIKVRNDRSGITVKARVIEPGLVRAP
tara:strand:+ start:2053 stop:2691 length:639 start_codon:yes stop_codon:yes gene_type:complete